jgi:hypothetical protein
MLERKYAGNSEYHIIYEHFNEYNNFTSRIINVFQPPPSDLVVNNIIGPDTANAGLPILLSWVVKNQGIIPPLPLAGF